MQAPKETALHVSASGGHLQVIKLLLEANANLDAVDTVR
jgi:hypothetical protein